MAGGDSGVGTGGGQGWQWDVVLSFAGAQRGYVEQVAEALKAREVRCFYDADEQIDLWGKYLAEELCSGQTLTDGHARRARKLAAEVAGPVPRSVYLKVLASGPCVYCGSAADTVDHVRPLSQAAMKPWATPGILEAMKPGRMQGHGGTAEVPG